MVSVCNGHLEVVKYLAECGADVHQKNEDGRTALMFAAYYGQLEAVKYLAEGGTECCGWCSRCKP